MIFDTNNVVAVSQYDYNPNEDYVETELKLREHLQSFLETVKSFNTIYTKVNFYFPLSYLLHVFQRSILDSWHIHLH
jgi:hypothetical protein